MRMLTLMLSVNGPLRLIHTERLRRPHHNIDGRHLWSLMDTVTGRMGCIPIFPIKCYGDGDGVARYEWAFTWTETLTPTKMNMCISGLQCFFKKAAQTENKPIWRQFVCLLVVVRAPSSSTSATMTPSVQTMTSLSFRHSTHKVKHFPCRISVQIPRTHVDVEKRSVKKA